MIPVTRPDLPPLREYEEYLSEIWNSRFLTNDGRFVRLLEAELIEYLGARNLILLNNGSLAIHLAVKSLELRGEVITTPLTFAATTNVLVWEGLKPVFADIDRETFNIDPAEIERHITRKTSAIVPVYTYGNPSYLDEIDKIADEYGLMVINDGAQGFAVEYGGKSAVNYGDVTTVSFHATKIFNTAEGGSVTTKDHEVEDKIRYLRNHGIVSEEVVLQAGTNAKMNELQAALGLSLLKYVKRNIGKRKKIYGYYRELLSESGVDFQKITASKYNYSYMPVILNGQRDRVYDELKANGIRSRKYFYPLTPEYGYFNGRYGRNNLLNDLPTAMSISRNVLCLPIYSDMSLRDVENIAGIVKQTISLKV